MHSFRKHSSLTIQTWNIDREIESRKLRVRAELEDTTELKSSIFFLLSSTRDEDVNYNSQNEPKDQVRICPRTSQFHKSFVNTRPEFGAIQMLLLNHLALHLQLMNNINIFFHKCSIISSGEPWASSTSRWLNLGKCFWTVAFSIVRIKTGSSQE